LLARPSSAQSGQTCFGYILIYRRSTLQQNGQ
jgi:hypothetical protein